LFFESVDFGKAFPSSIKFRDQETILDRIDEYRYRNLSIDRDALDAMAGVFAVYSLLGIFNTQMPLFYGEAGQEAFERLLRKINKSLKRKRGQDNLHNDNQATEDSTFMIQEHKLQRHRARHGLDISD
jgi:hypothetical protein